jgi:hypothetical protein
MTVSQLVILVRVRPFGQGEPGKRRFRHDDKSDEPELLQARPQFAFFTSAPILASSSVVNVFRAKSGALAMMTAWTRSATAIRFRYLGDLREHVAFPVRLATARSVARSRLDPDVHGR